jgi:4-amino-4-deoxy-L-arabinose transferase-like glycosyltransferase
VRVALTTALFDWSGVPTSSDDGQYAALARTVLDTGRIPHHHFPVGYPLFVAAVLRLAGGDFAAVRAVQAVLGAATVLLVAGMARRLYGRGAAVTAAWMVALYPPLAYMAGRVMSETLFIFLLGASLVALLSAEESGGVGRQVAGVGLFAVASLVRSNLVLLLPAIVLWPLRRSGSLRARLAAAVLSGAVGGAVLLSPGAYFLVTRGEFLPLATNAGQTFYGANNPLADGGWILVEDHPELVQDIPAADRDWSTRYSRAQYRLGFRWIREHPRDFLLRLLPRKLLNAWIPGLQRSEVLSASRLASAVLLLSHGLVLLAAVIGRWRVRPRLDDGPLLGVLIVYTVMSLIFYGNPRIGLFCAPVLIVYAASWASSLGARLLLPRSTS